MTPTAIIGLIVLALQEAPVVIEDVQALIKMLSGAVAGQAPTQEQQQLAAAVAARVAAVAQANASGGISTVPGTS